MNLKAISSFFKCGRDGGRLDGLAIDLGDVSYIGRNFNVIDSMWSEGRFHKRSDMKVRRVERFRGAIMRCRDCRLVRAEKPRAAKSGEMDEIRQIRPGTGSKEEKKDRPEGKNADEIVKSRRDMHALTKFPALRISGMYKIPRFSERNFNWGATNSKGSRYGAIVGEETSMVDNCGGLRRVYC